MCFFVSEKCKKCLQLVGCTNEVSAIVAPHDGGLATARSEPSKSSDEGLGSQIRHKLQMDSLHRQTYKDTDVGFHEYGLTYGATLEQHRTSIVHSNSFEDRARLQPIGGKLTKQLRLGLGRNTVADDICTRNRSDGLPSSQNMESVT